MSWRKLSHLADQLVYEDAEEGYREVKLQGARAAFRFRVFHRKANEQCTFKDNPRDLLSDEAFAAVRRAVKDCLETLFEGNEFTAWMSNSLPLLLNLPIQISPAGTPWTFQVLCVSEVQPAFILTLHDGRTSEASQSSRDLARNIVRMLMSSLMNYCHLNFTLLACSLSFSDKLNVEVLKEELSSQSRTARMFQRGPEKLTTRVYRELCDVVENVIRTTLVPYFLEGKPQQSKLEQEWLVLMNSASQQIVCHLLELLDKDSGPAEGTHLKYTPKTKKKMMTAVLEAARRLSFMRKVKIVTTDPAITQCIERLAQQAEKMHELPSSRFSSVRPDQMKQNTEPGTVYIAIDCDIPDVRLSLTCESEPVEQTRSKQPLSPTNGEKMQTENRHHENLHEKFSFLLVGPTENGKSSTGNSILGREAFPTDFFEEEQHTCVYSSENNGIRIVVVEEPAFSSILGIRGLHASADDTSSKALTPKYYDAVCFVINMQKRFTDDEYKLFEKTKSVLGDKVVDHAVVIFTHCGDKETANLEGELRKAPEQLKKILQECRNRYVFFENKDGTRPKQVDDLLQVVRKMNEKRRNTDDLYVCPPRNALHTNINNFLRKLRSSSE